ncbi:U1 small nuclear ribonucleoprotein 70 kda [Plakobranchus ocellatus]|uniref:U1 small nuclear ribonucleoprotein 70 kDa n=1 Tax=Plakobranchus ocellatus TaxID=259542 RepID=A0AAV3YJ74_9GAST|nr:U1 small nuclear ribonucleoprotein 70 kda [Plakobranchus ocellatus]
MRVSCWWRLTAQLRLLGGKTRAHTVTHGWLGVASCPQLTSNTLWGDGFGRLDPAYKNADGKKIDGRRVLVDVERGRTVKGWRPRRLGGGLGGTRKGGPDENVRFSGRDEFSAGGGYRGDDERGGVGMGGGRMARDRSRSRERRRRSRSRERPERAERAERRRSRSRDRGERRRSRSRERRRDKERPDADGVVAPEEEDSNLSGSGRARDKKRSRRSRSRDRSDRRRSRSRDRDRKRSKRSRSKEKKFKIKAEDLLEQGQWGPPSQELGANGGAHPGDMDAEIRIKEEKPDAYAGYGGPGGYMGGGPPGEEQGHQGMDLYGDGDDQDDDN